MATNGNGNGIAKFTPGDVAEVIALAGPGEEVPSSFKPFKQMLYRLADGRVWYAALTTGVKLHNLELADGERFRVCKRPFGTGSVIDVLRCNRAAAETGTVLEAKLTSSIAAAKRPAAPVVAAMDARDDGDPGPAAPNGRGPTPAPPALMTGQAQGRLACFCAAVDLLIAVEKYALLAGREVRFTAEDFRVCGNAWCIDASKGGR